MPTRIVWNKSTSPGRGRTLSSSPRHRHSPAGLTNRTDDQNRHRTRGREGQGLAPTADVAATPSRIPDRFPSLSEGLASPPIGSRPAEPTSATAPQNNTSNKPKRSIIDFRSSLLREMAVRSQELDDSDFSDQEEEMSMLHLSSDDIRASPRLLGYLFGLVAAAVQLVSVYKFYREEVVRPYELKEEPEETNPGIIFEDKYYTTSSGLIFRWKVWAALYQSAAAVGLCLATLLVHFDTILFPDLWVRVFRDGSLAERNWILFLVLAEMAGLHVATSVLSVGEYQANTYFSSWLGFASAALNYGVWRESAGLRSWAERVNSYRRETTYNWIWTGIFSCIFAGSATDMYYNSDYVELRYRGDKLDLDRSDWVLILSVVWTEVAVCILAVVINETLGHFSCKFPCRVQRPDGVYHFVLGWRQLEGLIIMAAIAAKFFTILEYTGYGGVVNGLSNAYFGIYGTFFNSVFAVGSWLRENKNLESFVRDPSSTTTATTTVPTRQPQLQDEPLNNSNPPPDSARRRLNAV